MERVTYTASEAAKAANVSMPTFYNWLHSEGFPAFRAGRKWIIPVEPFKRWLEEQTDLGSSAEKTR